MKTIFGKPKKTYKGNKFYGLMSSNINMFEPICLHGDKDRAIQTMDSRFDILVECEIRRVFIRTKLVEEIELD